MFGRSYQTILLVTAGLLFGAPAVAGAAGDDAAATDRDPLTASADGIRHSANSLYECPPLNIDPVSMNCAGGGLEFVTLAKVPFAHDQSAVGTQAVPALDAAAIYLLLNLDTIHRVYIEGHTDTIGDADYNRQLAARRAAAVRAYLMKRGISADRLTTAAFGDARPVDEYWTDNGRANNRRVGLYVVKRTAVND